MSNYEYEEEDNFDFETEIESSNAVKELRKANRAKERALKEMQAELETLRQERRNKVIKEVLGARGVSEKVSKFIPKDIGSDEESISSWLEENADVFGFDVGNKPEANVDPADKQNYQRMQNAVNSGGAAAGGQDLLNRILSADSPEELSKLLNSTGL